VSTRELVAKFEALPPRSQKQVEALVDTLSSVAKAKPARRKKHRFTFSWAGGLADLKDQFTAVELQHHINTLR
jgi:hypothetical protein